ncbi:MAG: hypothetical protein R3C60_12810 [Parvularculaceae bacterium]
MSLRSCARHFFLEFPYVAAGAASLRTATINFRIRFYGRTCRENLAVFNESFMADGAKMGRENYVSRWNIFRRKNKARR